MKFLRFFILLLFFPMVCWGNAHIVNQAYFLSGKIDKKWNKKDPIIVLGSEIVEINQIVRARKNFPKTTAVYWLLSDTQWRYNTISLNKDQKVLDFAAQLQEIFIQVLPENLCPRPALIHEKGFEMIVVDSSWFLFPHQTELFKQQCPSVDVDLFYREVEEAILNAKLKPVIIVAAHGVASKLHDVSEKDPGSRIANQIQQSLGSMNSISNPAYQRYQEKMNRLMNSRPNLMFVSGNNKDFFRDSNLSTHHIVLPEKSADQMFLENNKQGVRVTSKEMSTGILLEFNQSYISESATCDEFTGAMYPFKLKGWFYEYLLGKNYRKLWNKNVSANCFDLERQKLTIERIGGSLRSPDFELKDAQGKSYLLRPLKKEIRVPDILKETLVEDVLQDQQSSIFPLGFMLSAALSRQAGVLSEKARLVYIDSDQAAFATWREKKFPSGFYQFVDQPVNLLKDPELRRRGVLEVLTTKDMVNRLENESGYRLNQISYLRARLFDMLVGDWDRTQDRWQWVVIQKQDGKVIEPFPIDREASFYHSDGTISWWRRRKWVNYKLQDYAKRLKTADPMMVQSFSMDHRYTFALSQKDWDAVVMDLQQKLSPQGMEKAINSLPIALSRDDHKLIARAFEQRLKDLPAIAHDMRETLRESVDIVGTAGSDNYNIQAGPGKFVTVTQSRNGEVVYTDKFKSDDTDEIRIYGLDGDDDFRLNWENYTSTKVRLIPGNGKDTIIARDQKRQPKISLYDDNANIDSYYGFIPLNYNPVYNDFFSQANQRKFNVLTPVLFRASSNADSGFIVGGGLRYYKEGFQHAPWESINEIKANVVLNRNAANIMYQGTKFDIRRNWDFLVDVDTGLPRFYGNFFGLGNQPAALDGTKGDGYYWMRAQHLETNFRLAMPIFQYVTLTPRAQFRFRDYKIGSTSFLNNAAENQLDTRLQAGTTANIGKSNLYAGAGMDIAYVVDDAISGPLKKRIIKVDAKYMFNKGFTGGDSYFQTAETNLGLTGYFIKSKTQWRINGGYGRNFGQWEFFDAQFLGQGQNLRGFFMNRFAGTARAFSSFELNQSLMFRRSPIITDYGLGVHYDTGRVFIDNDTTNKWHKAVGGHAWITFLNSIAFKTGYAHAIYEDEKGFWSFVLTTEL